MEKLVPATLNKMSKKELIDLIKTLEHTNQTLRKMNEKQAALIEQISEEHPEYFGG